MAMPKPNDFIILLSGSIPVPGRRWKFSQIGSAVASARGEFLDGAVVIPLVLVALKTPTDVLWRIESR